MQPRTGAKKAECKGRNRVPSGKLRLSEEITRESPLKMSDMSKPIHNVWKINRKILAEKDKYDVIASWKIDRMLLMIGTQHWRTTIYSKEMAMNEPNRKDGVVA